MIYLITNQVYLVEEWPSDIQLARVEQLHTYLKNCSIIGFDTETEGFDPYTKNLLTAQFGDYENQYILDCTTVDIKQFQKYFTDPTKIWIMQNAKFDLKFLFKKNIFTHTVYDTMLAEKVLTTGLLGHSVGLAALVERYTNGKLNKSIRADILKTGVSDIKTLRYAADDVKYLHQIRELQLEKIYKNNLINALNLDNLFVITLAYIEYSGIKLDQVAWKAKMAKDLQNFNKYLNILNNWVIERGEPQYINTQLNLFDSGITCNINWSSSQQVGKFLTQSLGINIMVKDKKEGMKASVDAKVLAPLSSQSPLINETETFIDIYLKYKGAEKVVSTYGNTFLNQINPVTNRIHSNFTQIMDTGRLSCGGKNKATGESYFVNLNKTHLLLSFYLR